jgi:preprotein translocase subunit YajC
VIDFLQQDGGSFAPASTLGDAPTTTATTEQSGGSAAGNGSGAPASSPYSGMWVLGLMFVVIWMFLIRPERKRQRAATEMRGALKKGDAVVTAGGMHGKIASMDEATITLEIGDKVRVKFNRNAVAAVTSTEKKGEAKVEEAVAN